MSLALCGLRAQEQASTLLQLADSAAVVVHARAGAAAEPAPDVATVPFHVLAVLRGQVGADFTLTEPAGRCCGRALFAVEPGRDYLLFLDRTGSTLHLCAGDRGLAEPTAGLLQHVRALLRATSPVARADLLAAALASADRRVQRDAAQALAQMPAVALPASAAASLRAALARGLEHETSLLPALLAAASRFTADAVGDMVLPTYLADARQELRPLLLTTLRQQQAGSLARSLLLHWPLQEAGRRRAADLLGCLPAAEARPLQLRLLRETSTPGTALPLCEALLQQGCSVSDLRPLAPTVVLQLAEQRLIRPPGFRAVRPRR